MPTRPATGWMGAAGAAMLGLLAGFALGRAKKTMVGAHMALNEDWEKQLKSEHRAVKKVLKAMAATGAEDGHERRALLETAADALTRHAVEEENAVYPALRKTVGDRPVDQLVAEHTEMKGLIALLRETDAHDPAWADQAEALKALVQRHIRREESVLFPRLHAEETAPEEASLTRRVRKEGVRVSG